MVRMSIGNIRLHGLFSVLQMLTIAATSAFLAFVLGELVVVAASRSLPTAVPDPRARIAHLVWILTVALLVCTISNVTSMLLSVTQRFREIGTMKCLGAFDRTILASFLVESLVLAGIGAAGGAVPGTLLSVLGALFAHGAGVFSAPVVWRLAAGCIVSVLTVIVLSFLGAAYPAWRASRMLPIEAMRSTGP
jgi:ABC-type lipoprotein release transport system permease subunit